MSDIEKLKSVAGLIDDSARRMEVLFGYGYGGIAERLLEHLEKQSLCEARAEKAEQDLDELRTIYRHVHAKTKDSDACGHCGLDLRNDIHIRLSNDRIETPPMPCPKPQ